VAGAQGVASAEDAAAGGMPYRELGKTGLKVSEIGLGGVPVTEPAVIEKAFDKGINLFHTSPGYGKGRSFQAFAGALKNLKSKRDKMVLAINSPKLGDIDAQLQALGTDYVDLYVPGMSAQGAENPELPGMFEKLKKSGKVKFCGLTNHKGMADLMEAALKAKCVEVVLATYNMTNKAELDPVVKRLKEAGIGFLVMKSRKGVPKGEDPSAAIKTLLENKDVDSIVISQGSVQDVDKAVGYAGKKMTLRERREVRQLMLAMAGVCGSCGRCEGVCPKGLEIADIFRFHMYATQYEAVQREVGFAEYRRLGPTAQATICNGCGLCERVCPNAVPIQERLQQAHKMLA
jgi:predicted aldo/keto reductase-like oxidoreductase